jgi:hypothetical protein
VTEVIQVDTEVIRRKKYADYDTGCFESLANQTRKMDLAKHRQTVLGNGRYFNIHLNQFKLKLKMEAVCFSETVKHSTTVQSKNSKENDSHFSLKMEAVCFSETVKHSTTAQCKNSKENDSHFSLKMEACALA